MHTVNAHQKGEAIKMNWLRKLFSSKSNCQEGQSSTSGPKVVPTSDVKVIPTKIIVQRDTPAENEHTQLGVPEPEFILIPETIPDEGGEPAVEQKADEECEEPKPYEQFCAVSLEVARQRAAAKNLVVMYARRERWDLYGRNRRIYWALPPVFVAKLLRLDADMKCEDEFTCEEKLILGDMSLKKWVKTLRSNGKRYFFGLDQKTARILYIQIRFVD